MRIRRYGASECRKTKSKSCTQKLHYHETLQTFQPVNIPLVG